MTQVQDMTDIQLNFSLYQLLPGNKVDHAEQIPRYCTDPAASREIEAKAIEVNGGQYLINLSQVTRAVMPKIDGGRIHFNNLDQVIIKMLNASPRERAEAAYITLQGA